ncbi:EnvZ/OmpR regulon moderator MzrA [Kosakonia sacchari]|uniref:Modulator protein MzrA n=1 Tax=Kosakonia sacchari TaxID=1158459 RepID=A0A1G4XZS9_9ENTR|nr:EnvZ/OmpR regulon moderator MzrA [Kosakonia sacchari]AHJ76480.1 EnvZ/OmpR regulon moderator [Kosakonia sacchari SP1]ANR78919.1 EnvZ/OmpR regulon moderator [Kosakonia sacchari]MDN2485144.1 EnvZ/OmpR regulon moderator MzrA [Kosakonia sacchari]NUL36943.1 EnvZ/OmpR regulon moderator MzrA [Kosakonia sacchari]SCX46148.1 SecD export protein N-terminal TM region [Kosakonia sacchari]
MELQRPFLRWLLMGVAAMTVFSVMFFAWTTLQNRESTLAIRPIAQNVSVPDGFSVWHHLDANGIHFKSITPQDDTLLIKFESSEQSAAAKIVLDRTLPHGYIIAAQDDDNNQTSAWLTRLRNSTHRFG